MGCSVGWSLLSSSSLSTNLYSNMAEKSVVWSVVCRRQNALPLSLSLSLRAPHTASNQTKRTSHTAAILLRIDSECFSVERMEKAPSAGLCMAFVIFCSTTCMAVDDMWTMPQYTYGCDASLLVFKLHKQMRFFFLNSKHQTISNYSRRLTNGSESSFFTLFFVFVFGAISWMDAPSHIDHIYPFLNERNANVMREYFKWIFYIITEWIKLIERARSVNELYVFYNFNWFNWKIGTAPATSY